MHKPAALLLVLLGVVLSGSAWLAAPTARAADGLADIASNSYARIASGAAALAASGDPHASAVLQALQARHLFASPQGALFIRQNQTLIGADSGARVSAVPAGLRPVRVNNHVREAIRAALAMLDLQAPEIATRLRAADALYDSHPPASLPALDRALAHERDAGVRRDLTQARAAIVLTAPTGPTEKEAIAAIRDLTRRGPG